MASAKEIQSRIKSIQDTMKITNAMYMISSSKYRAVFLWNSVGNRTCAASHAGNGT